MKIICGQKSCVYHELGECRLDHAAPSGGGGYPECVYYTKKQR